MGGNVFIQQYRTTSAFCATVLNSHSEILYCDIWSRWIPIFGCSYWLWKSCVSNIWTP